MVLASRLAFVAFVFFASSSICAAQELSSHSPSANIYGTIGLNTVPTARMEEPGTLRLSVGSSDPYIHTQLGYQLHKRFYLGLRQTGEISSLRDDPDHVFPGLDLKLELFSEKKFRPEISLGMQSAFGHRRMAAEYLAFSKRYENFDFTTGFGWGRFGTRGSVPNPLDWTGSYLDRHRTLDGEKTASPGDWFTGDTGFFAGVEYSTPLKGVSLKADWSSDGYDAEKKLGYSPPSSFSFGVNYKPFEWADAGIAVIGNDAVMARFSLKSFIDKWPFSSSDKNTPALTSDGSGAVRLRNIETSDDRISGQAYLYPYSSTPYQLGQAWRVMSDKNKNHTSAEFIRIEPIYFGLKAPAVTLLRKDLLHAGENKGSAEEIWQNLTFDRNTSRTDKTIKSFLPFFTLRENVSLSEDDASLIHRTDAIVTISRQTSAHTLSDISLRYNLFSNLSRLHKTRAFSDNPIRSDEEYYLKEKIALERAFTQGFKSFSTDFHVSGSAGYLEEMFAGLHVEMLYRPWGKNWASGVELANVMKRDYATPLNLGLMDGSYPTGHANFYYEIPDTRTTFHASIGQYLGKDKGGTLSLKNSFENGVSLEAFITATDMKDIDAYGSTANISSGFRISLPLGSVRHIPDGSGLEFNAVPAARDAGQKLNVAHPLYDMTEPLSYRHIVQNWGDIVH